MRDYTSGLGIWILLTAFCQAEPATPKFETEIRTILRAHCFDCHGATSDLKGGLDLRLVRFQMKGGDSGPGLIPGKLEGSNIWERVDAGDMPPGEAKLSPEEKETLKQWILAGAPTVRPEPESIPAGLGITPEERAYWAFQPIRKLDPPTVRNQDQVANPIDAFVLARLEEHNFKLNPKADRATLARRAYLDLTGLPPTYEQVQEFVNDPSPNAWNSLVDNLLNSPHYGEHWGRHWLDVAGYADSDGVSTADPVRQFSYKYRDYIIRSLNADKSFRDFLIEQLAGDELVPQPHKNLTPDQIDKLVATGFLRMAADGTASAEDKDLSRNQVISDTIKIISSSLYGMSIGCAQCHDHRYDPIPQADYYALRAILEPAYNPQAWKTPAQRVVSLYTDEDRARAAEVENEVKGLVEARAAKSREYIAAAFTKELEKHPEELRPKLREAFETAPDKRTPEQNQLLKERPSANITPGVLYQYDQKAADDLKKMQDEIGQIRAKKPVEDFVAVLSEPTSAPPKTFLFHRGDHRQPLNEIAPGDLQVAAPEDQAVRFPEKDPNLQTSGRRLAWARHLTSGNHPMLPRVLVNRIWMNHFGQGIVATPGEFGKLGEQPSHPELLDWLASQFVANDWSLKALHRQIMTSNVYQQSSLRDEAKDAIDTSNRLYGRMSVRRLNAESIRDCMLTVAGSLDRTQFGPAVPVTADDSGQIIVQDHKPRRSIYLQVRRTQPESMLTAFDAPVMDVNCELRPSSTVASQSLMMMNGDSVLRIARTMAERARSTPATLPAYQIPEELATRLAAIGKSPWSFGYGAVDDATGKVASFTLMPHWTGSAWQTGEKLPDPTHGWVTLRGTGGHTGENKTGHAPIRRWTAPMKGTLNISGKLTHSSPNGDGVRGRVISDRRGTLGTWIGQNGAVDTPVASVEVEAGEVLDFVCDCRENVTSDSFEWPVTLKMTSMPSRPEWSLQAGFRGPQAESLRPVAEQIVNAWRFAYSRDINEDEYLRALNFAADQNELLQTIPESVKKQTPPADDALLMLTSLCQQLISSNEFLYVD